MICAAGSRRRTTEGPALRGEGAQWAFAERLLAAPAGAGATPGWVATRAPSNWSHGSGAVHPPYMATMPKDGKQILKWCLWMVNRFKC